MVYYTNNETIFTLLNKKFSVTIQIGKRWNVLVKQVDENIKNIKLSSNEKNAITHKAKVLTKRNEITTFDTVILPNMDLIEQYILAGLTEEKICKSIGMNYKTWRNYKLKYEGFKESILACKMKAGRIRMKTLDSEIEYIEAKPSKAEMLANLQKYIEGYPSYVYKNYERLFFMLYPEENHYLQNNIKLTEVNKFDAQTRRLGAETGSGLNRIAIVDDLNNIVDAEYEEVEDELEMTEEDFIALTMEQEKESDIYEFDVVLDDEEK